jgi:hypothetical protein
MRSRFPMVSVCSNTRDTVAIMGLKKWSIDENALVYPVG